MKGYLPVILESLSQNRHHYLLLSALKEVILLHANTTGLDFGAYIDQVLPHLYKHCESDEEGVRNMVAECFGALITMHPETIVPALNTLGNDAGGTEKGSLMRWTIASSLKYCMTGRAPHAVLIDHMETFLLMLKDDDLSVRHATLSMCNAAVHHQPGLIVSFLEKLVVPVLYETVRLKQERVVDLGPFKQKVDDGLPLRKTALACINTVLDTLPDQMDVGAFMPYLEPGLAITGGRANAVPSNPPPDLWLPPRGPARSSLQTPGPTPPKNASRKKVKGGNRGPNPPPMAQTGRNNL
eukprot:FR743818.1.p1 GENE.FR743818.1~~FR743818.1.p1  ORF type:complete len:315 (+),score=58.24 FR743818.1:56-946(+)